VVALLSAFFVRLNNRQPWETIPITRIPPEKLDAEITAIFDRIKKPLIVSNGETVSGLSVTPVSEMPKDAFLITHNNGGFDHLRLADQIGVAVELAPEHCLGCGCCCDEPIVPIDDADLSVVVQVPNIRWLRINRTKVTAAGLALFEEQKNLVWLDLRQNSLTDDALIAIGRCTSLKYLDLSNNRLEGEQLNRLSRLKNLETLIVSSNPLTDDVLSQLPKLPALKRLIIFDSPVTGRGMERLNRVPNLETLKITITGDQLGKMPKFPKLRYLDLRSSYVSREGLKAISAQSNLETLELYDASVSPDGVAYLGKLTRLKYLALGNCDIGNEDLAFVRTLEQLERIGLQNTGVDHECVTHLQNCSKLTSFFLPGDYLRPTRVSADAANFIAANNKLMRRLELSIEPSDDEIDLEFADMPKLEELNLFLPHDIRRVTLKNLPSLYNFRVMPIEATHAQQPPKRASPAIETLHVEHR